MARTSNTTDRRAQIVDALIAVMATHGYDGASIADVARKAGLAPGLVHYHFKNKLEILVEAVRVIAERHERALDDRMSAVASDHAARASSRAKAQAASRADLVAFIDVHLGLGAHAEPQLLACWVLVIAEALRERRIRAEVELVLSRLVTRVRAILVRGNRAGELACADVDATAAALVATIQGYFSVAATARDLIPSGSAASTTTTMMEALVGVPLARAPKRATSRTRLS